MKVLFCLILLTTATVQANDFEKFFDALAKVESSGNRFAVNKKEQAFGLYQIRKAYFLDSRIIGTHEECFDPVFARSVCMAYFRRYEPDAVKSKNWEILAKLHNGGVNWRKRNVEDYWQKVKKHL